MLRSLWLVHPDKSACDAFRTRFAGLPNVRVVRGRFEDLEPHDAFVTAGNSFGIMTAGIDAAVVARFGERLMQQVQQRIRDEYFGEQPVGTAFLAATCDPDLPFVVHAPTMRVPGSIEGTDKVYAATWAALLAVQAHKGSPSTRRPARWPSRTGISSSLRSVWIGMRWPSGIAPSAMTGTAGWSADHGAPQRAREDPAPTPPHAPCP